MDWNLSKEELENCINLSKRPEGFYILLKDKHIIFSENKKAYLLYAERGSSYITLGDPFGDEEFKEEVIRNFCKRAREKNKKIVFYEIGPENLSLYIDLGMNIFKIGEYSKINLKKFEIKKREFKNLRHSYNKINNLGYTYEIISKEDYWKNINELKKVSDEWLLEKNVKEKGFSLGKFDEEYLSNFRNIVVKKEDEIIAFGNLLETKGKESLALDLMRHKKNHPSGIMDYIFVTTILYGQKEGYKNFHMGMAPLAGISKKRFSIVNKIERTVYKHGEYYYNFKGLRKFKNKFHPNWESRYIAYCEKIKLPMILKDIALLISGGLRGLVSKR